MKRLSLLQLIPGMVVAQNVQASNGEMLIPHGTILNSWMITRLELYGILTIYVEDTVPGKPLRLPFRKHPPITSVFGNPRNLRNLKMIMN